MKVLIIALLIHGIDFAFTSFIVWLGSLIFPYDFSWVLSLFMWFVICVLNNMFKHKD